MTPEEHALSEDAKKFLGLPPYDTPSNIVLGDAYFNRACERRYGMASWKLALEQARK